MSSERTDTLVPNGKLAGTLNVGLTDLKGQTCPTPHTYICTQSLRDHPEIAIASVKQPQLRDSRVLGLSDPTGHKLFFSSNEFTGSHLPSHSFLGLCLLLSQFNMINSCLTQWPGSHAASLTL